jgi:hypothetical protein
MPSETVAWLRELGIDVANLLPRDFDDASRRHRADSHGRERE